MIHLSNIKNIKRFIPISILLVTLTSCSSSPVIEYPIKFERDYNASNPVYVIGHKSPDSDTVCSAIAYSSFLNNKGITSTPVTASTINGESAFILNKYNVATPEIVNDATGKQFALVDHGSYSQSIANMDKATVLAVVDHHEMVDITSSNPIVYLASPIGSTCSILYQEYVKYNVSISYEMAGLMISGILSDTLGLRSPTTTSTDKEIVNSLKDTAKISDYLSYTKEMLDAGNTYDEMTIEQILNSDYKNYSSGSTYFSVAAVQSTRANQLTRIEGEMNTYMEDHFSSLGVDMCFVMMVNVDTFNTKLLCYGVDALKTAKKAFNKTEDEIILENTVSRKLQVVPPLKEALKDS